MQVPSTYIFVFKYLNTSFAAISRERVRKIFRRLFTEVLECERGERKRERERNEGFRPSSFATFSFVRLFILLFLFSILMQKISAVVIWNHNNSQVLSIIRRALTWRGIIMESVNENAIFAKGNEKARGLSSSTSVSHC